MVRRPALDLDTHVLGEGLFADHRAGAAQACVLGCDLFEQLVDAARDDPAVLDLDLGEEPRPEAELELDGVQDVGEGMVRDLREHELVVRAVYQEAVGKADVLQVEVLAAAMAQAGVGAAEDAFVHPQRDHLAGAHRAQEICRWEGAELVGLEAAAPETVAGGDELVGQGTKEVAARDQTDVGRSLGVQGAAQGCLVQRAAKAEEEHPLRRDGVDAGHGCPPAEPVSPSASDTAPLHDRAAASRS